MISLQKTEKPPGNAVTLLFGGDFCPMRSYEKKLLDGREIFSSALMRELEQKDFFIVNLECPLCNDIFNDKLHNGGIGCDSSVATHLKRLQIDVAGLANNHVMDKTGIGLQRTMELLDANGIVHGGAGPNLAEASRMLVIEKSGLRIGIWILAEKELNVATPDSPGSSFFNPELNALEIPRLREQVDFLVCFVHAGHEFMLTPSPRIRHAYRSFVDAGADAVVGHHPHVPQGMEQYHGGWIFYSLGNLVFDSPYVASYPDTDHGYLVRMHVGRHEVFTVDIIPYRLAKNTQVETLSPDELTAYKTFLERLCRQAVNDDLLMAEWRKNVTSRWNQDYESLLAKFSSRFVDESDKHFLSVLRNMVQCPTCEEIMTAAIDLMETGTLKRQ